MRDNDQRRFVMDVENTSVGKQNLKAKAAARSLQNQLKNHQGKQTKKTKKS